MTLMWSDVISQIVSRLTMAPSATTNSYSIQDTWWKDYHPKLVQNASSNGPVSKTAAGTTAELVVDGEVPTSFFQEHGGSPKRLHAFFRDRVGISNPSHRAQLIVEISRKLSPLSPTSTTPQVAVSTQRQKPQIGSEKSMFSPPSPPPQGNPVDRPLLQPTAQQRLPRRDSISDEVDAPGESSANFLAARDFLFSPQQQGDEVASPSPTISIGSGGQPTKLMRDVKLWKKWRRIVLEQSSEALNNPRHDEQLQLHRHAIVTQKTAVSAKLFGTGEQASQMLKQFQSKQEQGIGGGQQSPTTTPGSLINTTGGSKVPGGDSHQSDHQPSDSLQGESFRWIDITGNWTTCCETTSADNGENTTTSLPTCASVRSHGGTFLPTVLSKSLASVIQRVKDENNITLPLAEITKAIQCGYDPAAAAPDNNDGETVRGTNIGGFLKKKFSATNRKGMVSMAQRQEEEAVLQRRKQKETADYIVKYFLRSSHFSTELLEESSHATPAATATNNGSTTAGYTTTTAAGSVGPNSKNSDSDGRSMDSSVPSSPLSCQQSEHVLMLKTAAPFFTTSANSAIFPPAGSAQEQERLRDHFNLVSLALDSFLQTTGGNHHHHDASCSSSSSSSSLTSSSDTSSSAYQLTSSRFVEKCVLYINFETNLLVTIRPSDTAHFARIRRCWTDIFSQLTLHQFIWYLVEAIVLNYSRYFDDIAKIINECESLSAPSLFAKVEEAVVAAKEMSGGNVRQGLDNTSMTAYSFSTGSGTRSAIGSRQNTETATTYSINTSMTQTVNATGGTSFFSGAKEEKENGKGQQHILREESMPLLPSTEPSPPIKTPVESSSMVQKIFSIPKTLSCCGVNIFRRATRDPNDIRLAAIRLLNFVYRQVSVYDRALGSTGSQVQRLVTILAEAQEIKRQSYYFEKSRRQLLAQQRGGLLQRQSSSTGDGKASFMMNAKANTPNRASVGIPSQKNPKALAPTGGRKKKVSSFSRTMRAILQEKHRQRFYGLGGSSSESTTSSDDSDNDSNGSSSVTSAVEGGDGGGGHSHHHYQKYLVHKAKVLKTRQHHHALSVRTKSLCEELMEGCKTTRKEVTELVNLATSLNANYLDDYMFILTFLKAIFDPACFVVTACGMNFIQEYSVIFDLERGYLGTWLFIIGLSLVITIWFGFYRRSQDL